MNREIKFRAWDKDKSEMIYDAQATYDFRCRDKGCLEDNFQDVIDSDDYILMQYTGLKDRKGIEIWEGDIVSYMQDESNPKEVYYKDGVFWPLATFNTDTAVVVLGNVMRILI